MIFNDVIEPGEPFKTHEHITVTFSINGHSVPYLEAYHTTDGGLNICFGGQVLMYVPNQAKSLLPSIVAGLATAIELGQKLTEI